MLKDAQFAFGDRESTSERVEQLNKLQFELTIHNIESSLKISANF